MQSKINYATLRLVVGDTRINVSKVAEGGMAMTGRDGTNRSGGDGPGGNLAYIRQMLGQLRQVAYQERAHMLCYLIEMAYIEAGDLQISPRGGSDQHRERN